LSQQACGVPLLGRGCDLGVVQDMLSDGSLNMNAFKPPGTDP